MADKQPHIPQKQPVIKKTDTGTYFWCRCGKSDDQPFCDGSHKGSGFDPVKVEIEKPRRISWCACKHTGDAPFCDGTHNTL